MLDIAVHNLELAPPAFTSPTEGFESLPRFYDVFDFASQSVKAVPGAKSTPRPDAVRMYRRARVAMYTQTLRAA